MVTVGNHWKDFYLTWWTTYVELSILFVGLSILLVMLISSLRKLYCMHTEKPAIIPARSPAGQLQQEHLSLSVQVAVPSDTPDICEKNITQPVALTKSPSDHVQTVTIAAASAENADSPKSALGGGSTPASTGSPQSTPTSSNPTTPRMRPHLDTSRVSGGRSNTLRVSVSPQSRPRTPSAPRSRPVSAGVTPRASEVHARDLKSIQFIKWYNKLLLSMSLLCSVVQVSFSCVLTILIVLFGIRVHCGVRAFAVIPTWSQRCMMYGYFVLRIYDSFRESVFEMKKKWLLLCFGFFFCIGSACIAWYISVSFVYASGDGFVCDEDHQGYATGAVISVDAFGNVMLVILFVRKLSQVGKQWIPSDGESKSTPKSQRKMDESQNCLPCLFVMLFSVQPHLFLLLHGCLTLRLVLI